MSQEVIDEMLDRIKALETGRDMMDDRMESFYQRHAELRGRVDEMEEKPVVRFKKLRADAVLPKYATAGAAGMDLVACIDKPITLWPGAEAELIPTGLAVELPKGYEAQVRPRSGLSLKGIAVANAPGTVDEDYRGEVKVIMRNHGHTLIIHNGDRIAQLVIAKAVQAEVVETDALSETERAAGGFGSTGVSTCPGLHGREVVDGKCLNCGKE